MKIFRDLALVSLAGASLAACATAPLPLAARGGKAGAGGTMRPYEVRGVWYTPRADPHYNKLGLASWYGARYHNRVTADGEAFDETQPSAAHTTLPLPSWVEVTNLDNGRKIRVRLNDRGPFVAGRIVDLSPRAAEALGFIGQGTARVRVRYLGPAPRVTGGRTALAANGF